MPIIIKDGDIIDVLQETPIQSNRISQVNAQEYKVTIGYDTAGDVTISHTESANSVFDDYIYNDASYTYVHNETRIETYYTTGSFTVSFTNFTARNVAWTISGNKKGKSDTPVSYTGSFSDSSSAILGTFSDYDAVSTSFAQKGLWNGGTIVFNDISIADESEVSVSISGGTATITYKILTKLCAVKNTGTIVGVKTGFIYDGSTIIFTIGNRKITLEDASIISVGRETDNIVKLDDNPLFATSTISNELSAAVTNCKTIRSQWLNGKDSCKIRVIVGEYYDENGDLAISSKNTENHLPMLFNVGDIVIPYIKIASEYTEDEETYVVASEDGISTYSNGDAKRFVVVDEKYVDDGVCSQELTLVETSIAKEIVVANDNVTNVTITRISSDIDGAKIGVLDDNVVYLNDVIQIDVVKDYSDDYLVFTVDGVTETSGVQITVKDAINVVAKVKELNDFTWAEIASISESGQAQDFFNVGDTKVLKYSGGSTVPYYITFTIVGFNHDDLSDGTGKAGITFAMDNLLEARDFANGGGYIWTNSTLRTELNTIYTKLQNNVYDNTLPTYIKQVKKKYFNFNGQSPVTQISNEYVWIYSTIEIDGIELNVAEQDGQQYEYWQTVKDGSIASNRIKFYQDGLERIDVAAKYPTRTALFDRTFGTYVYYYIDTDGEKKYNRLGPQCHLYIGFCI